MPFSLYNTIGYYIFSGFTFYIAYLALYIYIYSTLISDVHGRFNTLFFTLLANLATFIKKLMI